MSRSEDPKPGGPVHGALLVEHDTEYEYSTQVAFAQHLAHLTPMSAPGQSVRDFVLEVEPRPALLHTSIDFFGNLRTIFSLSVAHESLRVCARSRVQLESRFDDIDLEAGPPWEQVRDSLQFVAGAPYRAESEFSFSSALVRRDPALAEYARVSFTPERPVLAAAAELMHRIHRDFRYDVSSTDVSTPVLEAFAARAGVCQDFTHVMIGCLRSLGLAARYISGYLHTQPRFAHAAAPAGAATAKDETPVVGANASHAWVSVYSPQSGWVELDPTNDAIPGTGHIRLACGRDYGDVAPLRGVVQGGGEHELRVAVRVTNANA
jgi:transglutaminase-like putative cysteine protease